METLHVVSPVVWLLLFLLLYVAKLDKVNVQFVDYSILVNKRFMTGLNEPMIADDPMMTSESHAQPVIKGGTTFCKLDGTKSFAASKYIFGLSPPQHQFGAGTNYIIVSILGCSYKSMLVGLGYSF